MDKKRFIPVVCLIILLSGCGGRLCHPYKTKAQFDRDKYDCECVAIERTHQMGFSGNPFIIVDEMQDCMIRKHGWSKCQQRR